MTLFNKLNLEIEIAIEYLSKIDLREVVHLGGHYSVKTFSHYSIINKI